MMRKLRVPLIMLGLGMFLPVHQLHPQRQRQMDVKKKSRLSSVFDMEIEQLKVEREQLQVFHDIKKSLVDLNTNLQMVLAVMCHVHGLTMVAKPDE